MTNVEMVTVVTRRIKDLHLEIARTWGVAPDVITEVLAGATFGLGVTMVFECGHDEEQILAMVRDLVTELSASPTERGAS
jgi:hypothetical protein